MPIVAGSVTSSGQPAAKARELADRLAGELPDSNNAFAIIQASGEWVDHFGIAAEVVSTVFDTAAVIGCTAESTIQGKTEHEMATCLTVWVGQLNGASPVPFRLSYERLSEGSVFTGLPDRLAGSWTAPHPVLLLADPFSFPADLFLERWNEDRPGVEVIGGMASAAQSPGGNRLAYGVETLTNGAVGIVLENYTGLKTVVSQGCRPIGDPMIVTGCERNKLFEVGGRSALSALQAIYAKLPTKEQAFLQQGLHLGLLVDEYKDDPDLGDFLIRNVVGIDQDDAGIVIADYLRKGQTVQFHLRDASTASADLKDMLRQAKNDDSAQQIQGGFLVSCNGRGTRMFPDPHHDASLIQTELGEMPLSGFFAAGEFGAVGGRNFLHGFTASLALFL